MRLHLDTSILLSCLLRWITLLRWHHRIESLSLLSPTEFDFLVFSFLIHCICNNLKAPSLLNFYLNKIHIAKTNPYSFDLKTHKNHPPQAIIFVLFYPIRQGSPRDNTHALNCLIIRSIDPVVTPTLPCHPPPKKGYFRNWTPSLLEREISAGIPNHYTDVIPAIM